MVSSLLVYPGSRLRQVLLRAVPPDRPLSKVLLGPLGPCLRQAPSRFRIGSRSAIPPAHVKCGTDHLGAMILEVQTPCDVSTRGQRYARRQRPPTRYIGQHLPRPDLFQRNLQSRGSWPLRITDTRMPGVSHPVGLDCRPLQALVGSEPLTGKSAPTADSLLVLCLGPASPRSLSR